jgi:hypothetical protein
MHPIVIGDFVNQIPASVFILIHVALFIVGAVLAYRCFSSEVRTAGWGFALFAVAEISYMTYHLDITTFLAAHTLSEVLDVLAFVLVFVGFTQRALRPAAA